MKAWLVERLARHALPHYSHEQHLAGDRWIRVEERRTADGGSIGVRLVSGTVRDLIAGSGIDLAERGVHRLKGVPGEWRVYAVAP